MMVNIFSRASLPSVYPFIETSAAPFLTDLFFFLMLLLSLERSLYTLDNSPFSDMGFANVFSHSVVCFLKHPLIRVFSEAKVFFLF